MSASSHNIRELQAGDLLFQEGDKGDHIYFVQEGHVEIVKDLGTPKETVLQTVGKGEFIGEMAVLEDLPRMASAKAIDHVKLVTLDRTGFMSQAIKDPHAALVIMRNMSNRLRKTPLNNKTTHTGLEGAQHIETALDMHTSLLERSTRLFAKKTILAGFSLVFLMVSALCIMMFVEVETTVSAYARVVPKIPNLIIESGVDAILKEVRVKEGQIVEEGQIVVLMDTGAIDSEIESVQADLAYSQNRFARLKEEKEIISSDQMIEQILQSENKEGLSHALLSRLQKRSTKSAVFDHQLDTAKAKALSAEKEKENISEEYKLVKKQMEILNGLKSISRMERIDKEVSLASAQHKLSEKETALREAIGKIEIIQAEKAAFISQWNDEVETQMEADKKAIDALEIQFNGLKFEREKHIVRSPVKGRVLDLLVHREGTVLSKGNPIADITRSDQELVVMAEVPSKDVGALVEGLPVSFKLDALPFQRYGDIAGTVMRVDEDSVASKRPGVKEEFYMVRIYLEAQRPSKASHDFILKRGMIGRADLITGKRSILSYLMDPILGSLKTAFKEGG